MLYMKSFTLKSIQNSFLLLLPVRASEQGNVIGSVRIYIIGERDTLRSVQLRIADIYIMFSTCKKIVLITRKEGGA